MILLEVGLKGAEADIVPVDSLVIELGGYQSVIAPPSPYRHNTHSAALAVVHKRLHPLEAVGARRHSGRGALVASLAVGLNVLLPDSGGPGGVHVGLADLVGPDRSVRLQ